MSRRQRSARQAQILVATANPVPASAVGGYWRDPVGQAAFEHILRTPVAPGDASPHPARLRPGRPRLVSRRPLVAGAAAAAALVLIAGGVLVNWLRQPEPVQRTVTAPMLHYVLAGYAQPARALRLPSARSVLLRLAKAAAARPPIKQPPGARVSLVVTSEWYMSTAVGGGTSTTVVIPEVDKTWYKPDGAWRQLERFGRPIVGAVGSEQTLRAAESGPPISDQRFPAGDTSNGPDVSTLSDNPVALRRQLLAAPPEGGVGLPAGFVLFRVIPLLHHQLVGPALDAAMWRVLAGQSGVRFLGTVTDRAGRRGDAVEVTDSQGVERLVLIISRASAAARGEYAEKSAGHHAATAGRFPSR
jgi:hypothetical protein